MNHDQGFRYGADKFRNLDHRPLDSFANGGGFRRFHEHLTVYFRQLPLAVEHHHEVNQVTHDHRLVAFPAQLVVNAVEAFRGGIETLSVASCRVRNYCASLNQATEHGRYHPHIDAGAIGDLAGGRRLPEVDHRDVDPPFAPGQCLEVTAEILGVLVDKNHEFFHQLPQRPMPRKPGDDDEQPRVAAGQNLERPDLSPDHRIATDRSPQTSTIFNGAPSGVGVLRAWMSNQPASSSASALNPIASTPPPLG